MQINKYHVDIELLVKETSSFEVYAPDTDTATAIATAMLEEDRKRESYIEIYNTKVEEKK